MSKDTSIARFRVSSEQAGLRLDYFVAQATGVSRRIARIWIATGRVLVNNKPMRILSRTVRVGVDVRVYRADDDEGATAAAETEPTQSAAKPPQPTYVLNALFVDRYILVVDKPSGLLSEGDRFGSPTVESLAPLLLRERGERREHTRIWLVHRLDAGTSGVMVLARTPMAARVLSEAFRSGSVRKTYLALCDGRFDGERTVDAPIARAMRTQHVVSTKGKPACTYLRSLAATDTASVVRAEPKTGRTHQIRVHLKHLGHPLLGDALYGGPRYLREPSPLPIRRAMLHAAQLRLQHPKTEQPMVFHAPLPADFSLLITQLKLTWPAAEETL